MGNIPSNTGQDRGGAHGRRDIVRDGSRAEQRPGRFRADESDTELAGSQSDMECNRKSRIDSAPEPVSGYSLPDVAVTWQVAPVSSLHTPPVGVVGRLPVVE